MTQIVELNFIPKNPKYSKAANEYENIWFGEKGRIIKSLEQYTGFKFWQKNIHVNVSNEVSNSGYNLDDPMSLYYDFDEDFKKATLIHELGHRIMLINMRSLPTGYDPHQLLDLFLYDVWVELYGREFAKYQIEKESEESRKKIYDFEKTWKWALSMSKKERAKLLKRLISGII